MSFDILNRYTQAVLYHSDTAPDVSAAAKEAIAVRADLSRADLSGAYLSRAYLSRADLSRADLSRANLSRAYLSRANLSRADLSGANLSGVIGLLKDGLMPLQIMGTRHALIARTAGYLTIGCHHNTLAWWEEHYAAIGRTEGYTSEQVTEYRAHIAHARQWMEKYGIVGIETPAEIK